ncbi:MAG TPA: response regulator transcription factor [Bryobacteraceae bacterium]|nr:response regulator transcription factor [Bryobacteraceae bacterium]
MSVRVLLVDDNVAFLQQIANLLSTEFTVVATASDGQELLSACDRHNPDIIVTDIAMPGVNGIEAARTLRAKRAKTPIVMLTVDRAPEMAECAMKAGATAYVDKLAAGDDLIPAIRSALLGKRFISVSTAG